MAAEDTVVGGGRELCPRVAGSREQKEAEKSNDRKSIKVFGGKQKMAWYNSRDLSKSDRERLL